MIRRTLGLALMLAAGLASAEDVDLAGFRAGVHSMADVQARNGKTTVFASNDGAEAGVRICYKEPGKRGQASILLFVADKEDSPLKQIRVLGADNKFPDEAQCLMWPGEASELRLNNGVKLGMHIDDAEKLLGPAKSTDGGNASYANCVGVKYKKGKVIAISHGC